MGFKHILKRLLRTPLFTALTILTLAIGIGANTAIFSVVDGILLRPSAFSHPGRTRRRRSHARPASTFQTPEQPPSYISPIATTSKTFQDIGLWNTDTSSLTGLAEPEEIRSLNVTPSVLPILKLQPFVGRVFSEDDGKPGQPPTSVLSVRLLAIEVWRRWIGGRSHGSCSTDDDGSHRRAAGAFRFLDTRPGRRACRSSSIAARSFWGSSTSRPSHA